MSVEQPQSARALFLSLLRLGLPILVSMAALIGLGVTDTLMAGLASTRDLAALAIGANLCFIAIMLLIGLQSVVAPRISFLLGADTQDDIRHEAQQALWLGIFVGFATTALLQASLPLIAYLGLAADVERIARAYIAIVSWTMPLIAVNLALRNTIDGLGYTRLNMLISLLAFVINLILDYLLVFGKFGFPALGALGCAIATCAVVAAQSVCIIAVMRMHPRIGPLRILHGIEAPRRNTLARLAILGFPAAFAITLEEGFFSATTLLAAPMGSVALGAHQVVLNIGLLALIIPIAFGQAGAILIGRSLGARQARAARQQVFLILAIISATMLVCALLFVLVRRPLVALYSGDPAVIALGSLIVFFLAAQLLVDGMQIGANIILKGYQDTLVPALAQIVSYWLIGFPLGFVLTQTGLLGGPWGLPGIWIAMLSALSCSAVLNVARLLWISRAALLAGDGEAGGKLRGHKI